ncbi:MAG TPA: sugar ABC transporter substrate-binding protein [Firmicutes bacterium]|nr:sugar ABC transporter substrate-binding protein [Bacillota bacterium]
MRYGLFLRATSSWMMLALVLGLLLFLPCPRAAAETTITWGVMSGPQWEERYNRIIAAFEKAHPDIKVKWVGIDWPFQEKLLTLIAAGEGPDVIRIDVENLPEYVEMGMLEDLNPYLKRETSDPLEGVFPAAVRGFVYRGRLYGIPQSVTVSSTYYNVDLFEAGGVVRPSDQWTWSDMVTVAKRLTKDRNGDNRIDQFGLYLTSDYVEWLPLLYSHGGDVLDQEGRVVFDSPASLAAFSLYQSFRQSAHIAPRPGELAGTFQDGYFGMIMMCDWVRQIYRNIQAFRWDIATIPAGPKGQVAFIGGGAMGINAASRKKDQAWEFVKFFTSEAVQNIVVDLNVGVPVRERIAIERYVGPKPNPPHLLTVIQMLRVARWAPQHPRWRDMLAAINQGLPGLLNGQTSPAQFITKTADSLRAIAAKPVSR